MIRTDGLHEALRETVVELIEVYNKHIENWPDDRREALDCDQTENLSELVKTFANQDQGNTTQDEFEKEIERLTDNKKQE